MTVRSPGGINLRYRFTSIAAAMAATLPPRTSWAVVGTGPTKISSGLTGAEWGPIYPAVTGSPIPTPEIDADTSDGYEVVSGCVTAVLSAPGTGYIPTEVVEMDGGLIGFDTQVTGVKMSIVVDTVGGGGEIETWHISSGRAGHGDYVMTPEIGTPIASTGSVAGVDATWVLTRAETGFALNGNGQWILNPHRSVGTPTVVWVRLHLLRNTAAGLYFPRVLGVSFEVTSLDQLTTNVSVEQSSFIGLTVERVGTLDGTAHHMAATHKYSAGGWHAGTLRIPGFGQGQGNNLDVLAASDQRTLEWVSRTQNGVLKYPFVECEISDLGSASKMEPLDTAGAVSSSLMGWNLTHVNSATINLAFPSLVACAGLNDDDEQTYLIGSVRADPTDWAERPLV